MPVVLMDTDRAAGLAEAYLDASRDLARRLAVLSAHSGSDAALGPAIAGLRSLASGLAADSADVAWRRLWLLQADSLRLGPRTLGWVPGRSLRSRSLTELLPRWSEAQVLDELAIRALADAEQARWIAAQIDDGQLREILASPLAPGTATALAILLAAASRSGQGLEQRTLDALLPTDATHAATRISAFGQMLSKAQFSDQVLAAAAAWATDPANRPHLELAMSKHRTNFAAAALGAAAGAGAIALLLASTEGRATLTTLADPQLTFELQIDGDETAAEFIDAVTHATANGEMDAAASFEVWRSLADHLVDSSLPGSASRMALAELTNHHWDEIRLLSTEATVGLFAELASDDSALATISLELGARSVPPIAAAARDFHAGRDISVHVQDVVSGYDHVFTGIAARPDGLDGGGLVASALDAAISAAAAPAGPAVAWVGRTVGQEVLDHVLVADHPGSIATPRDLFEHEFRPSNTAVPGGFYPAVSAFEVQVLNEVLSVESGLRSQLAAGEWLEGGRVRPPIEPSDRFAEWFARSTSGQNDVARSYQALRSEFSDKVLLEVLKVETQ